jgi:hypothetical protein
MNPNREGFSMIEAMNWYSYCSNNPVNYVDPTGQLTMADEALFLVGSGVAVVLIVLTTDKSFKQACEDVGESIHNAINSAISGLEAPVTGSLGLGSLANLVEEYEEGNEDATIDQMGLDMPEAWPGKTKGDDISRVNKEQVKKVESTPPPQLPTDPEDPNNKPKNPIIKALLDLLQIFGD